MRGESAIAGIARRTLMAWVFGLLCAFAQGNVAQAADRHEVARRALVAELRREAAGDRGGLTRIDDDVLAVLGRVPRHAYVPASQQAHAYENRPLAIGHGQTISQPYIVALMTTLVQPKAGQKILEIGTGSGYQAAVLAESGAKVYTIEIVAPLAALAAKRLRAYRNVTTRTGDGYYGWKEQAPFDAIVVTAAASSIPPPLLAQLKPGGRMVIPVGSSFFTQTLLLVQKDAAGRVRTRQILPVRFVPLTGRH
jgi:protein-L-isoaspartate(D-aspartate) O-methyltransferase